MIPRRCPSNTRSRIQRVRRCYEAGASRRDGFRNRPQARAGEVGGPFLVLGLRPTPPRVDRRSGRPRLFTSRNLRISAGAPRPTTRFQRNRASCTTVQRRRAEYQNSFPPYAAAERASAQFHSQRAARLLRRLGDQRLTQRRGNRLGARIGVELGHRLAHVSAHRFGRDE